MPKKFLPIIASIEQCYDVDKMPFEEAVGRIKAFEARIMSHDEPDENDQNKLLLASLSDQENWKLWKGMRCYECGEFGHFAYECTKWKEEVAHVAQFGDDGNPALL
ncbi:hypothetical protein E3N88_23829 [Mikania micrantha]|uniref:CCHC-type domain-containing protein n=1 Tax=Mikania micrantha TaxID=192012 RepID=A0A5N6NH19_9ASTR|nr:hypothetical protein E3N88_23829 [Mikania micrantha]